MAKKHGTKRAGLSGSRPHFRRQKMSVEGKSAYASPGDMAFPGSPTGGGPAFPSSPMMGGAPTAPAAPMGPMPGPDAGTAPPATPPGQ
jgi:hypothetical protein